MNDAKPYRFACVGAGLSGLAVGQALGAAGEEVAIIDAGSRVGGKLLTDVEMGSLELGASTISNLDHRMQRLLEALSLEREPVTFAPARYHLRGVTLCERDFRKGWAPYALRADERGLCPRGLLLEAMMRIAPQLRQSWPVEERDLKLTLSDLRFAEIYGRRLVDLDFADALGLVMSAEATALIEAGLGSSASVHGLNGYDAMSTLLYEARPGQIHAMVKGGIAQVAFGLSQMCSANVSFILGHKLQRLGYDGQVFELGLSSGQTVKARDVVLALPLHALLAVEFEPALLPKRFYDDLQSLRAVPVSKLHLSFVEPAALAGCSRATIAPIYTDLAPRQIHLIGADADGGAPPAVSCFADGESAAVWTAMCDRGGAERADRLMQDSKDLAALVDSSAIMIAAIAGADYRRPRAARLIDWSAPPFHGAWHVWRPGARSWRVAPRIMHPNKKLRLFICGETAALRQGWTEGTLENVEVMLERHFACAPFWSASFPNVRKGKHQ